jgi:hypothetical protein
LHVRWEYFDRARQNGITRTNSRSRHNRKIKAEQAEQAEQADQGSSTQFRQFKAALARSS